MSAWTMSSWSRVTKRFDRLLWRQVANLPGLEFFLSPASWKLAATGTNGLHPAAGFGMIRLMEGEHGKDSTMPLDTFCRQRSRRAEMMDQPNLEEHRHFQALAGLARINWWSGSAGILWPAIRDLARQLQPAPLRILDVACGAGDVPIRLWHKACRASVLVDIDACDISSTAVAFANRRAQAEFAQVRFFQRDALCESLPDGYHVVTSSLFLHHLEHDQAVTLLQRMQRAASHLVLVNDLRRGWLGYVLAYLGTRVLSTSRIVHVDGPLSVQGAFNRGEALELAREAGLNGAIVEPRWPFRFLLTSRPP
jgi:2-polyprenyl-3-methyl-5-hydroxy-6-metoxy-1,4-benzoquinol methylase